MSACVGVCFTVVLVEADCFRAMKTIIIIRRRTISKITRRVDKPDKQCTTYVIMTSNNIQSNGHADSIISSCVLKRGQ